MSLREQEWVHQYQMLKRKIQTKRQAGKAVDPSEIRDLNSNLEFLVKNLQILIDSPMEYEISSSELARRQLITENLKKQIPMIPVTRRFGGGAGQDVGAFGAAAAGASNNSSTVQSETSNPMSNKDLVQRQKEVMALQDDMLLDISKGVDRLHNQAMEIGTEAKQHLKILNELDTHVDKAAEGLREEAKHAETIRKTSNVCYMYICVVIEVIIIIVLLLVAFKKV